MYSRKNWQLTLIETKGGMVIVRDWGEGNGEMFVKGYKLPAIE